MSDPERLAELEAENARLRLRLAEAGLRSGLGRSDDQVVAILHRARNTLAMIRAIVRRSAEGGRSAGDCVMRLDGRLAALARVQSPVLADHVAGLDLHALVADALLVHLAREGEQADLSGPRVLIRPKAAEIVALALHELAANAVEHGALTRKDGHVRVAWQVATGTGAPRLDFAWIETGLSGLRPDPERRGFGTETLERTLRYELGADTTLAYAPEGRSCTIRFTLPAPDRIARWRRDRSGRLRDGRTALRTRTAPFRSMLGCFLRPSP